MADTQIQTLCQGCGAKACGAAYLDRWQAVIPLDLPSEHCLRGREEQKQVHLLYSHSHTPRLKICFYNKHAPYGP